MGTSINPPPTTEDRDPTAEDLTNQNDLNNVINEPVESPDHEDILDSMGRFLEQQLAFDKIINAEVMIQNGDEMAMCCTPRMIDVKPCTMDAKCSRRDHWMGRLGKVPTHANHMLHMYVCASAPAPRPSQKPLRDTFCVPKNTPFSLFLVLCFYHLFLLIPTLLTIVGY